MLVETWRLLAHRTGRSAADTFLGNILEGGAEIEVVGFPDLQMAHAIGHEFVDQDFSNVDRTGKVVMRRLGVHRVATFDHHFAVYRFGARRERAFTVVR